MATLVKPKPAAAARAAVYCPICTHTVDAEVVTVRKGVWVKPGQKCPRCNASLDAAFALSLWRAA
jgi:uncharacterized protein (UPF0212 family)